MAEQEPAEGTMIECVGGGPADGTVYCYRYPEIVICSISSAWDTETHIMEVADYWSHIYHYNPTTKTYEYKGVRK